MTAPAALREVPTGRPDRGRTIGWWGVVATIATEASIFAALLAAYFYVRATSSTWPQGGLEEPKLGRISLFTIVLLASSAPLPVAERAIRDGALRRARVALAVNFGLGALFLANQAIEYRDLTFGIRDNAYASLFYLVTGLHGLHVLVGLGLCAVVQAKAWTGRLGPDRHGILTVFSLYWHFVDVVWVFVFSSLYLSVSLR